MLAGSAKIIIMILIFGFQKANGGYEATSYTVNMYHVMPYEPGSEKTKIINASP